jgi:hypothetical protein
MNFVALKMLTADRAKYFGLVFAIAFCTFLLENQTSIFANILKRTASQILDVTDAEVWVMDPKTEYWEQTKALKDTDLTRVRGVPGVQWAVRLFKGSPVAKTPNGKFAVSFLVGLDDATLAGAPRRMLMGSWERLREPDSIVIDKAGYILLFEVNKMTTIDNSWVLITGASSGFGEEFARQYAGQGHPLVLVARRLDRLQRLAEELRQQSRIDVVVEQVDLSDVAAVIQLHERLRERGIAIDILINNAGHGLQAPFLNARLDATLAMVQLDVASLTAVTHIFAQDMRTRGRGKIMLVASLLAFQGVQNFAVYSAAKAYVLRLGEALHRELKRDGVTVTTLCPGMSDTGFATAAQQKLTPALKLLMMQPAPVVRAGIRALQAGRISVVPGWANKASVILMWASPRWLHQAIFSRIMNG